ncbi:MAG: S8 family serine peptidase [Hyphomicrobiaceae bacterium]
MRNSITSILASTLLAGTVALALALPAADSADAASPQRFRKLVGKKPVQLTERAIASRNEANRLAGRLPKNADAKDDTPRDRPRDKPRPSRDNTASTPKRPPIQAGDNGQSTTPQRPPNKNANVPPPRRCGVGQSRRNGDCVRIIVRTPLPSQVTVLPHLSGAPSKLFLPDGGGQTSVPPPSLPPVVAPPIDPGLSPAQAPSIDNAVPDEVLITVAESAPQTLEAEAAQSFNVVILERTSLPLLDVRLVRLRIPDNRSVGAVVQLMIADPRIELAQPNFYYQHSNGPSTAQPAVVVGGAAPLQYALMNLKAGQAHKLSLGRGARIAIIDSGVDTTHPDFVRTDIQHFDATGEATTQPDMHGTGVAGLIIGQGTVQGIAPKSSVLSARVFSGKDVASSRATSASILRGMAWSTEQGARVFNMSFAGPRDRLVERFVKAVAQTGVVLVAAAGNGGPNAAAVYPAAYEDVIAVTAIDHADKVYGRANRGAYVAIAAPGVDVLVPSTGASHEFQSGTSYAAAYVSGIVALALEINPTLQASVIRKLLFASAEDLGQPGRDTEFGYGRINAEAVVTQTMATAPMATSAKQ